MANEGLTIAGLATILILMSNRNQDDTAETPSSHGWRLRTRQPTIAALKARLRRAKSRNDLDDEIEIESELYAAEAPGNR